MPPLHPPIRTLLRLEGATVLVLAVAAYTSLDYGWILFGILLFLPDLTMLGYLAGAGLGATSYNIGHTYVGPAIVGAFGWAAAADPLLAAALIWAAHIGLDRMLGYGLKLPSGFRDTHLGAIRRE